MLVPVFISHSREDNAFCKQFVDALRAAGVDVWIDMDDILPGRTLISEIAREIYGRPVFIIIVSRSALASRAVFEEFCTAQYLQLYDDQIGRTIIPITIEPLSIRRIEGKWSFLLPITRIEANYAPLPFDEMVRRTLRAIPARDTSPPPPTPPYDEALPELHLPAGGDTPLSYNDVLANDVVISEHRNLLSVFLLLDTSMSMDGPPIIAVNNGVRVLYNELIGHLSTVDITSISVMTFANDVLSSPLTPLRDFVPPIVTAKQLTDQQGTAFGAALACLKGEIDRTPAELAHGEKIMVIVLTDGEPTDSAFAHQMLLELNFTYADRIASMIVLGCGPQVDKVWLEMMKQTLNNIDTHTLMSSDITPQTLREFFGWAAKSVQITSSMIAQSASSSDISWPALPPGLENIDRQGM